MAFRAKAKAIRQKGMKAERRAARALAAQRAMSQRCALETRKSRNTCTRATDFSSSG